MPDFGNERLWDAENSPDFLWALGQHQPSHEEPPLFSHSALSSGRPRSCGSLPRHLFLLLSIAKDIFHRFHQDTQVRQEMEQSQALPQQQQYNAALAQQIAFHKQVLADWLAMLRAPTAIGQVNSCDRPFLSEVMPWFWACQHILGVLHLRTIQPRQRRASFDATGSSDDLCDPNNCHMRLIVQIREALYRIDGGAVMFTTIGTDALLKSLPPLPAHVATASITGFFPPLAVM